MSSSLELDITQQLSEFFAVDFAQPRSPMSGASHDVWLIDHPVSGEIWTLRIAKNEYASCLSDRGTLILRYLKEQCPSLQIPKLICQSEQFAVFQFLKGDPIDYWDSNKLDDGRRHHLLDDLAVFLFQMWTCPVPKAAGAVDYKQWLQMEIDSAFMRSLESDSGWGDPLTFLHRRATVDAVVPERNFPRVTIKHGDISAWNVLMDENGISGVIDWDTAEFVPLPAAIHHPLFIADIPGWQNAVPADMTFDSDRKYLENAISKLASESSDPDAQDISKLLPTCFERQFFELSLISKLTNEKYIESRINGRLVEKEVLQKQLGAFITLHDGLRTDASILALQKRMRETEETHVTLLAG